MRSRNQELLIAKCADNAMLCSVSPVENCALTPGTENTMHVVALGKACRLCHEGMTLHMAHMTRCRDELHRLLRERFEGLLLNG